MKICVVTGTRAEYGLLYWLLKEIQNDEDLQLQLVVTGTHLEEEFGLTVKEIEKEFKIDSKINLELKDDSKLGIANSMALAQIGFTQTFLDLSPDLIILLGDRYEIFVAASSALICKIPIAHIHGGEVTQGAYDDAFRHSITKMSHLHFTATEEYKNRVIQLGEEPDRVFNVGGMGIENIKRLKLLSKEEFEKSVDFKLNKKNLLITFHPETLSNQTSKEQFQELIDAIDELEETNIIFTKANSDTDGKIINQMIDKYVLTNSNSIAFTSLGQLRYLSALQYVDTVVGNSSSGLLEAPSFRIATINIGDRQKGRRKASSVIDCKAQKEEILKAINNIYSDNFRKIVKDTENPYGNNLPSKEIINIIKKFNFDNILIKNFHDIKEIQ